MQPIGLIVGHGYTKAVNHHTARAVVFPSVAAPAAPSDFDAITGGRRAIVNLGQHGDWLIGQDAITFGGARAVATLDRSRYQTPAFVALARHALAQVALSHGPGLRIVSGMPAAWFADKQARQELEAALLDAAAPWGDTVVTVAPEAAGVFYSHVFEPSGLNVSRTAGEAGVIDLGYRDANVARFSEGRYVDGTSIAGGMAESLKEIRRLVAAEYGIELSLADVDATVRAGCVWIEGEQCPLPDGSKAAIRRGVGAIVAAGRSLWPNGGKGLRTLLIAGGGAELIGEELLNYWPHALVVQSPQLAGARGFAAAAAAQLVARRAA